MATFNDLGKATKRGCGACAACSKQYANAHKPQCCSCGHFLAGKFKGSPLKVLLQKKVNLAPLNVTIFQANSSGISTQLCSVRTTNKDNRTFVLESLNRRERICYNQGCRNVRSSYVNSQKSDQSTCKHLDAAAVDPVYKIGQFLENKIENCIPDKGMSTRMKAIQKQFGDLQTVVKISEKDYVTKGTVSSSDPLGYVHVAFSCEQCVVKNAATKRLLSVAINVILKRKLAALGLKRKSNLNERNKESIQEIIREEMTGPGMLAGYRTIWHALRLRHQIHIPRHFVAGIMKDIDPDGVEQSGKRKLKRRTYSWHIHGAEKTELLLRCNANCVKVALICNRDFNLTVTAHPQQISEWRGGGLSTGAIEAADVMYFLPEYRNRRNFLVNVADNQLDELQDEVFEVEAEANEYEEYFTYILQQQNLNVPVDRAEAFELFQKITSLQWPSNYPQWLFSSFDMMLITQKNGEVKIKCILRPTNTCEIIFLVQRHIQQYYAYWNAELGIHFTP
eukprot:gene2880-3331_t